MAVAENAKAYYRFLRKTFGLFKAKTMNQLSSDRMREWQLFARQPRIYKKGCIIIAVFTGILAVVNLDFHFLLVPVAFLSSAFIITKEFSKKHSKYIEILRDGARISAKVIDGVPMDNPSYAYKNKVFFLLQFDSKTYKTSFVFFNSNFSPFYKKENYKPPRTGDVVDIYFLSKYPNDCFPVLSKFFVNKGNI